MENAKWRSVPCEPVLPSANAVRAALRRCCRRRRLVVSGAYRAPETPPPQYASADRRLPHLYRFVSPFDSADRPPDKLPAGADVERLK